MKKITFILVAAVCGCLAAAEVPPCEVREGVEHLALVVPDRDAMVDWWVRNLGFRVVMSRPKGSTFIADKRGLAFEVYGPQPDCPAPDYASMPILQLHFGFYSDDVEADVRRLEAAGAKFVVKEKVPGLQGAILRDPFGIPIQVMKRAVPLVGGAPVPRRVLELPPSAENCRNSEGDFALLADGRVMLVYSHYVKGQGGDHDPAHLAVRISKDGGRTWPAADDGTAVANEGGMNVMSVSTLRRKDGSLALFYLRKNSETDCRPVMRVSKDEGRTWGDPVLCVSDADIGYYVLNNCRAERLASGRIVLPMCLHDSKNGRIADWAGRLVCALSDDDGATWRLNGVPFRTFDAAGKRVTTQEPGVVQLKDGRVLMYARTGHGRQWFYYSSDDGLTWTKGEPGSLWGPCGPATLKRLSNGDLFAVWNDHEFAPELAKDDVKSGWGKRVPLTVAVSKDEGKTWVHRRTLEGNVKNGWYCYFAVAEVEGRLLLEYCALKNLRHSRVTEIPLAWLYDSDPRPVLAGKGAEPFFKDGGEAHVYGTVAKADELAGLHPGFAKAFGFLKRGDLAQLPPGRYEIDGTNAWAMVQDCDLIPFAESNMYEAHGAFIDIQMPISGAETIGVVRTPEAQVAAIDAEKDCALWKTKGEAKVLKPGEFAVFFPPYGAHAPGLTQEAPHRHRKLVIKVRR